jgi:hypothetical protein
MLAACLFFVYVAIRSVMVRGRIIIISHAVASMPSSLRLSDIHGLRNISNNSTILICITMPQSLLQKHINGLIHNCVFIVHSTNHMKQITSHLLHFCHKTNSDTACSHTKCSVQSHLTAQNKAAYHVSTAGKWSPLSCTCGTHSHRHCWC